MREAILLSPDAPRWHHPKMVKNSKLRGFYMEQQRAASTRNMQRESVPVRRISLKEKSVLTSKCQTEKQSRLPSLDRISIMKAAEFFQKNEILNQMIKILRGPSKRPLQNQNIKIAKKLEFNEFMQVTEDPTKDRKQRLRRVTNRDKTLKDRVVFSEQRYRNSNCNNTSKKMQQFSAMPMQITFYRSPRQNQQRNQLDNM